MWQMLSLYLRGGHPARDYTQYHWAIWFRPMLIALAIYFGAIAFGLWLNVNGRQEINFLLGLVFQLTGLLLLAMPGNWLALIVVGFFLGQPGKTDGLSIKDGVDTSYLAARWFGRLVGAVVFFGSIPFEALGIFSFVGKAGAGIVMLSLAIPVSIGAAFIWPTVATAQKANFFTKLVYWILVAVIVGALGTTSRETYYHYVATQNEQIIRDIGKDEADAKVEEDAEALRTILKDLKGLTTAAEKKTYVDRLPKDSVYHDYKKSLEGKSPSGMADKAAATGSTAIAAVAQATDGLGDKVKGGALRTWHGERHIRQTTVGADTFPAVSQVCDLPIGDYTTRIEGVSGGQLVWVGHGDLGILDPRGDRAGNWALHINGERLGRTVAVTRAGECLTLALAIPDTQRASVEAGEYKLTKNLTFDLVFVQ